MVLVPHATRSYYHVVSLDMRKHFVEVSLTSDGGRIDRVLGIICFQFQGQNDIYSALLSRFPIQLCFLVHILRVSGDDSADCIPCMSHLQEKGGHQGTNLA